MIVAWRETPKRRGHHRNRWRSGESTRHQTTTQRQTMGPNTCEETRGDRYQELSQTTSPQRSRPTWNRRGGTKEAVHHQSRGRKVRHDTWLPRMRRHGDGEVWSPQSGMPRSSQEGRSTLEEDQRRVARRTDMGFSKAIEKERRRRSRRRFAKDRRDHLRHHRHRRHHRRQHLPEMRVRHDKRRSHDKSGHPQDRCRNNPTYPQPAPCAQTFQSW